MWHLVAVDGVTMASKRHRSSFLSRQPSIHVVFAEHLFKRLNLDDAKHVVTLVYCLVRLGVIGSQEAEAAKYIDKFKPATRKNW